MFVSTTVEEYIINKYSDDSVKIIENKVQADIKEEPF